MLTCGVRGVVLTREGSARNSAKDLLAAMPLSPCPAAALVSVFSELKSFEPAHSDTATHPSAKSTLIRKFIKRALHLVTNMIGEETTDVELGPRFEYWP